MLDAHLLCPDHKPLCSESVSFVSVPVLASTRIQNTLPKIGTSQIFLKKTTFTFRSMLLFLESLYVNTDAGINQKSPKTKTTTNMKISISKPNSLIVLVCICTQEVFLLKKESGSWQLFDCWGVFATRVQNPCFHLRKTSMISAEIKRLSLSRADIFMANFAIHFL